MNNGKPPPVLTKYDFTRRYARGEFGNAAPTWLTLAEFQASDYRAGNVHIRNRVAGGPTWYNVPWHQVVDRWMELVTQGVGPSSLYLSAMAPHKWGTIQGEVRQSICGLHYELTYCSAKLPMRESMSQEVVTVDGTLALLALRRNMDPASFDWFEELIDRYPDHVIEFSCFAISWGTIPNRNTVFWEVRKY